MQPAPLADPSEMSPQERTDELVKSVEQEDLLGVLLVLSYSVQDEVNGRFCHHQQNRDLHLEQDPALVLLLVIRSTLVTPLRASQGSVPALLRLDIALLQLAAVPLLRTAVPPDAGLLHLASAVLPLLLEDALPLQSAAAASPQLNKQRKPTPRQRTGSSSRTSPSSTASASCTRSSNAGCSKSGTSSSKSSPGGRTASRSSQADLESAVALLDNLDLHGKRLIASPWAPKPSGPNAPSNNKDPRPSRRCVGPKKESTRPPNERDVGLLLCYIRPSVTSDHIVRFLKPSVPSEKISGVFLHHQGGPTTKAHVDLGDKEAAMWAIKELDAAILSGSAVRVTWKDYDPGWIRKTFAAQQPATPSPPHCSPSPRQRSRSPTLPLPPPPLLNRSAIPSYPPALLPSAHPTTPSPPPYPPNPLLTHLSSLGVPSSSLTSISSIWSPLSFPPPSNPSFTRST
ncbi:hypothetical protein JCM8547_002900 [Rhodosporidiobolus lusitaniae]